MAVPKILWSLSLTAAPEHIEAFAAALDDGRALALTTLTPPRAKRAKAEALYADPPARAVFTARLAIIAALHKTRAPKLAINTLSDFDWLRKVATDFPPLPIARWVIYGAQHKSAVANPRRGLEIEAASAFGTGEHPTTRGCLLMLDRHLKKTSPRLTLDIGTGSGILAMACAQATSGRAMGVEIDPVAVTTAKGNVIVNGLGKRVRIIAGCGYKSRHMRRGAPYDLIMTNIFAEPLARMAKDLRRYLAPGGTAILAGLLTAQANRVLTAHRSQRIYLARRLIIGEWTILALKRPVKAL